MGRFLRTLAKVGLVELDSNSTGPTATTEPVGEAFHDAELEALLAEDPALLDATARPAASQQQTDAPTPNVVAVDGDAGIEEGRSFATIYQEAGVPESPFPVERLIRLLEGLKAMKPDVRRAAVQAMDAADESWTMEDALLDAERKVAALQRARGQLAATLAAVETKAQADIRAHEEYQAKATAEIRKQIEDLEQLLAEELHKVAHETATTQAQLEAARQAHERENARITEEIARLEETSRTFSSASGE